MGRYGQLVMGPAGSGKSTYCNEIFEHCQIVKRRIQVVNLDPAAEEFTYPVAIDIRDLICIEDATEELKLGPNGGLIFCMEYLADNIDWLLDQIGEYEGDYLIFDCPGQIEVYSHYPIMNRIVGPLKNLGYNLCAVYLLDALFVSDPTKFISGALSCLSVMIQLELPHLNVMSKCDLIPEDENIEKFVMADMDEIKEDLDYLVDEKYHDLNDELCSVIEDFNYVSFLKFNINDEKSIELVLMHIDRSIQYGEDNDVVVKDYE